MECGPVYQYSSYVCLSDFLFVCLSSSEYVDCQCRYLQAATYLGEEDKRQSRHHHSELNLCICMCVCVHMCAHVHVCMSYTCAGVL